ncbi:MAG: ferredoxin subunit of nitrite reductase and ring-hydroxylating dioxygenase [Rhodocyclaceae bacterium]|nr:ferredoxin subunit of nitrite reductase and ring-hydroxylating dioxygenase [Rhodocyclaceae bacterium]
MAENQRLICLAGDLSESGSGVRFTVPGLEGERPAFAIRYGRRVYAYLNECSYVPAELDWQPGEFFDHSKLYLICSIHGALYAPESGRCLGGRCQGKGLKPLRVEEREGAIYLLDNEK